MSQITASGARDEPRSALKLAAARGTERIIRMHSVMGREKGMRMRHCSTETHRREEGGWLRLPSARLS